MSEAKQNYYGGLCTEMYEILHEKAPQDELNFYLSYAGKDKKILEPLCGSGRFLVPFMERGFDISGIDSSKEMLGKLKQKAPNAKAICADIREYSPQGHFDYIFISSGSVSLFTDMGLCKTILTALKEMLSPKGKLVFAVDTIANRCPDDSDYKLSLSVKICMTSKARHSFLREYMNYTTERNSCEASGWIFKRICIHLGRWNSI